MHDILYIIVLYHQQREQSPAWQSLRALLPKAQMEDVYVHDNTANNEYLAKVYNRALRYAQEKTYRWLVLLDADTAVTAQYIEQASLATRQPQDRVFCPVLEDEAHRQLSPRTVYGIPVAFNSGMVIPLKIFDFIGQFNEEYPLDYLDYWFCYQLHLHHAPLLSLPVTLVHRLSVSDYSSMPQWRYLSLLKAEKQFAKETGHPCRYRLRLFGRWVKWIITGHPYIHETFQALLSR